MLKARDYRQRAWSALKGKWGTLAVTFLLVQLVTGLCSGLNYISVGFAAIGLFILEGPIAFGRVTQAQKVVRGMRVEIKDILAAKNKFGDSAIAFLLITIFVFLWSLLFLIPGIIAGYSYSMTFFVLADNPNMTGAAARKESIRIMKGNKWRLFCLHFSFFGWLLLCVLTFGILLFWIWPYMHCSFAEFYESIKQPIQNEEN